MQNLILITLKKWHGSYLCVLCIGSSNTETAMQTADLLHATNRNLGSVKDLQTLISNLTTRQISGAPLLALINLTSKFTFKLLQAIVLFCHIFQMQRGYFIRILKLRIALIKVTYKIAVSGKMIY